MPAWVRLTPKQPRAKRRKPATLAQVTEKPTQAGLVRWLRLVLPHGSMVYAVVNEAPPKSRDPNARARFFDRRKMAGVVTGFPDLGICLPGGKCVYIETKRPIGGVVSSAQQDVHAQLEQLGHVVGVANSIEAARHVLRQAGVKLRESAAEHAEPARVRLAKPRAVLIDNEIPF